ncbi:MAG: TIR domain-containing protein [Lachnospiraceae bacterium]|nr:TIR domain-containing protein [Lachnospiraceae bacterium]
MELKYITRGNSKPQGKPRVYFSCHPADFETYFDKITDEILNMEDCVIWYDDKSCEPEDIDSFLNNLSQIQLIVIPVTSLYLTEHNRSRDAEFLYAAKQHIPVLPLMQEEGIDVLFNEICGNIQYLMENDTVTPGLSYEEKLEKYLSSVLIGGELLNEVRAAFDAHIFLSYRKADKEYAEQLMRLIHNCDFCKSTAIWYDEFLTAGENFDESIIESLENCELFAMVVTPNLINEDNYVMTTEYPLAVKYKKPLLPVEMTETDYGELAAAYEGIPKCVDAKNTPALSAALRSHLQEYVKEDSLTEPRKNYLIGLAYLSGIDTEVNKTLAVEFITSSAGAGLLEAMEKLAEMFVLGEGVAQNYDTAANWYRKIAVAREQEYFADPDNGFNEYLSALIDYASCCHHLCGSLAAAEDAYLRIDEITMADNGRHHCSEDVRLAMYNSLGSLYLAAGEYESAYQYYDKARSIESLPAGEGFTELNRQRALQTAYYGLCSACQKMGRYREAWEYLQKDYSIASEIVTKTGESEDTQMFVEIYGRMGYLRELQNDISSAKNYYYKGLTLSRNITLQSGASLTDWLSLAASNQNMGKISAKDGDFALAYEYYMFALSIYESTISESRMTIHDMQNYASLCLLIGKLEKEHGVPGKAKEFYERSLSLHEKLWENYGLKQSHGALALLYYELGCFDGGNIEYLQTARQILYEDAKEAAYNGTRLSKVAANSFRSGIIMGDIKKRIRKMKRQKLKSKIKSKITRDTLSSF